MIAHHQMVLAAALLSLVGHRSAAIAGASQTSHDPPWNSEHISRLPEQIRQALIRLCGDSALAAHYFATYSDNSRLVNLHFEHFQCRAHNVLHPSGLPASGLRAQRRSISTSEELLRP
jgi:hypothetical protein